MKDALKIAQEFGNKHNYPIVTPMGEKNGYKYFHITRKDLIGRKTGLPRVVKIGPGGRVHVVESTAEIMMALELVRASDKS